MRENVRKNNYAAGSGIKAYLLKFFSLIGLVLVVIVLELLTGGRLLNPKNIINIFNNFFSISLLSMGIIFLMSIGELDLSIGAIVGLSTAMAAFSFKISFVMVFPAALLTGLLIGCLNGIIIAQLKVPSFIATLSMSFIVRGLTVFLLNGSVGVPLFLGNADNDILKISVFILIFTAFYIIFEFKSYGKRCRAIGASSEAARQSGVNVKKIKISAFIISGIICGLVGFFSLVRTCTASSTTGNAFEFKALLALLCGGMPLTGGWQVKFKSAVIGSMTMAVLYNGMSLLGVTGLTQQIIQGVLLIIIVCVTFDRRNTLVVK